MPVADKAEVTQILRDGCAHMRRAFDIEDINLDELIATAMEDPQAVAGDTKVLQGLRPARPARRLSRVLQERDGDAVRPSILPRSSPTTTRPSADLPDHAKLKGCKLPGASLVLDGRGERFAELYEPDHRRVWRAARRHPRACAKGLRRRRGQALLPAQGHRRARRHPRLHRQPRRARAAAGRLDHHPAGGQEPARRRRRHLRAQDARDDRRLAPRARP